MSGADQSAVGSNVISTPSGGSSMSGMGEGFSASPFTGTGSFSIPFAVLPGRNDVNPNLVGNYDTGNGNTEFGWGWSLGQPSITCQTRKGVPTYRTDEDVYRLAGAEDLIEISKENRNGYIVRTYQPRTEGLFARIERYINATSDFWKVWSKDGMISIYGADDAQAGNIGQDTARTAQEVGNANPYACVDPENEKRIFEWKLNRTIDVFGNYIQYNYKRDQVREDRYHLWDKLYLDSIQYIDFKDNTGNTRFLASVQFEYEERPDPFSKYNVGFEIRTVQRCKKIKVYSHPENVSNAGTYDDLLSKSYTFFYADEQVKNDRLDPIHLFVNGASSVTAIQAAGHDGDKIEYLPPVTFRYSQFESKGKTFEKINSKAPLGYIGSEPDVQFVDLFGNGLPDIIQLGGGAAFYWENRGNGEFTAARTMKDAPAGISLEQEGISLVDTNGNGRIDLQVNSGTLPGYYPLTFDGTFDRKSFKKFDKVPSFNTNDPEVKFIDLDGDGATDVLRNGERFECFFLDEETGYDRTAFISKQTLDKFPNVSFSDPRIKLADMTGDGLTDIVFINSGSITYWPNLGYGKFGRKVVMKNSPKFPKRSTSGFLHLLTNSQILIGDIDGDGVNDLVYVDNGKTYFYINQGGNSWSEPIKKGGTPPLAGASLQLLDLKGKGSAGLAFIYPPGFGGRNGAQMYYLDLLGAEGEKPYQLTEMSNNMGAVTKIRYRSSVIDFLRDDKKKETRWKTKLPFPVQVVAKTEVIDFISQNKLVTEYNYHHGYWDGYERSFIGFGKVEQIESEGFIEYNSNTLFENRKEQFGTPHAFPRFQKIAQEDFKTHYTPPLKTISWFHLGAVENPDNPFDWKEEFFEDEYWQGDKQLLSLDNDEINFIKGLSRKARRDYYRTKRGSVLRTELYALDQSRSGVTNRPYTVTETLNHARLEYTPTEDFKTLRKKRLGSGYIFFSFQKANRTTQWERGDDPMTQINFTEDFDKYGNPQKSLSFALPQGYMGSTNNTFNINNNISEKVFIIMNATEYLNKDEDKYFIGRIGSQISYEVKNSGNLNILKIRDELKSKSFNELKELSPNNFDSLNIFANAIMFYDGTEHQGLSYGNLGDYGIPVKIETLCAQQSDFISAYGSLPYYLDPSNSSNALSYYPQSFKDGVDPLLNYQYHDGSESGKEHYITGYYCIAERKKFDFHRVGDTTEVHGLTEEIMDSRNNVASIEYDDYFLLSTKVTDPNTNDTISEYDYRTFQSNKIVDANENVTRYRFSPLGYLQASYIIGNINNGDQGDSFGDSLEDPNDQPSIRYDYNFFHFYDNYISNAAQLNTRFPIYVKTIARETHHNDSNSNTESICTIEYSDGFGRLVQTRTQAEETVFGESFDNQSRIVSANSGLPSDQTLVGTNAIGNINNDLNNINVIVSGWQVYDNKGRIIEKYEPFYAKGLDFDTPIDNQLNYKNGVQGEKVRMYYDPRGKVIRTINANNSQQWILFGKPYKDNITTPNSLHPSPWEVYTYDESDLANEAYDLNNPSLNGEEFSNTPISHHYTPNNSKLDALGRTIETIERNDKNGGELLKLTYSYDIRGNVLLTKDAFDRTAIENQYDFGNRLLKTVHIDGGIKTTIYNASNQPIEVRDNKGSITLFEYDELNRPLKTWARDNENEPITLRQEYVYGESSSLVDKKVGNHIGKLYQHKDESGIQTIDTYDFKGNIIQRTKQLIGDESYLSAIEKNNSDEWNVNAFKVDWENPPTLESNIYTFTSKHDALNRITELILPNNANGDSQIITSEYNKGGALERLKLNAVPYIDRISYNARGQRILMALGNNTMTRYAYDNKTFRLKRLRTERFTKTGGGVNDSLVTYSPIIETDYSIENHPLLQDFAYEYDFSGNITKIKDRTPNCHTHNSTTNHALDRQFEYDALYRLISATGRETATLASEPWNDSYRPADHTIARSYTRNYEYDIMGNILAQNHVSTAIDGGNANFNKQFQYNISNNALQSFQIGMNGTPITYNYDENGNIKSEGSSRFFEWDAADNLRTFYIQTGSAEPSKVGMYAYDSSGMRTKKIVRTQGGNFHSISYLEGVFEYTKYGDTSGNGTNVNLTIEKEESLLHIMNGDSRIATIRSRKNESSFSWSDTTPSIKYCHEDHLGNGSLYSKTNGELISREEYYPFGGTSFGSYEQKRYRFNGKERDEESGLYYYGLRYYATWICRFFSVDPMTNDYPEQSSYLYAGNNPIMLIDIMGAEKGKKSTSNTGEGGGEKKEGGKKKMSDGTGKSDKIGEDVVPLGEGKYAVTRQKKSNNSSEAGKPQIKNNKTGEWIDVEDANIGKSFKEKISNYWNDDSGSGNTDPKSVEVPQGKDASEAKPDPAKSEKQNEPEKSVWGNKKVTKEQAEKNQEKYAAAAEATEPVAEIAEKGVNLWGKSFEKVRKDEVKKLKGASPKGANVIKKVIKQIDRVLEPIKNLGKVISAVKYWSKFTNLINNPTVEKATSLVIDVVQDIITGAMGLIGWAVDFALDVFKKTETYTNKIFKPLVSFIKKTFGLQPRAVAPKYQ